MAQHGSEKFTEVDHDSNPEGTAGAMLAGPVRITVIDRTSRERMIITIDGPAAVGKSSTARELAKRLGLELLNTGAMYRTAAALVLDNNIDPCDSHTVCGVVAQADLHFDWTTDPPAMLCSGKPLPKARLDARDVTDLVSPLAGTPALREHMVRKQRIIAAQHRFLLAEGRDQGSAVFPNADVKFYLTASATSRAKRRLLELSPVIDETEMAVKAEQLEQRDHSDRSRGVGPLVQPPDAWVIDSTDMGFDEVVSEMERIVHAHVGYATRG